MNTDSREACECKENDIAEITAEINEMMPDEENLYDLAELFKVFGDSTRIQILYTLLDHEKSVGDIAEELGMNASAISHQLRVLKQAKLVKFRKDGKIVYYSLDDEHVSEMYEMAKRHIEESYSHK